MHKWPGRPARSGLLAGLFCGAVLAATSAAAQCRQALALGLDVSRSVDGREYRLQLDGIAAALLDPAVQSAILAFPDAPVSVFIYEWSDPTAQRVILPWTSLAGPDQVAQVAARLRQTQRAGPDDPQFSPDTPGTVGARTGSTGLGAALDFAWYGFANGPTCWRKTLDISGDGPNNSGPTPRSLHPRFQSAQITINALAVGADPMQTGDQRQAEIKQLSSYFSTDVILGPDAFVQTALGYEDYQAAMTKKLLRELQVFILGAPRTQPFPRTDPPLQRARATFGPYQ